MKRSVFTLRGTGEGRGVRTGMCGAVARKLNPDYFDLYEIAYPATIGRIGAGPSQFPHPLDESVTMGVELLAKQIRDTQYPAGIISYSLGGIVASRFLEAVEAGEYLNTNGKPLQIDFVINIANPSRAPGESVVHAPGYGLHSSHGRWPARTAVYELANPADIICSADKWNPARRIAGNLSPYSALQQRNSDPFKDLRKIQSDDVLARLRPGRYLEAAIGLGGYLFPDPRTGVTQHTLYASQPMPGSHLTWTDWAADQINRRYAR